MTGGLPPGCPPGAREGHIGPVPHPGWRHARRLPPGVCDSQTSPLADPTSDPSAIDRDSQGGPPHRGSPSSFLFAPGSPAAGRGRPLGRPRPLVEAHQGGAERSAPRSLTMRWLVTHESTESRSRPRGTGFRSRRALPRSGDSGFTHTRVTSGRRESARSRARVMWHSPQTVSRPRRCESPGPQNEYERPLRICEVGPGPAAASRDAAGREPGPEWARRRRHRRPSRARRPDRRGQAPKGTGGMPRRHQDSGVEGCEKSGGAAQRASIPECPRRPGELKHLSTRRKGNQPRLPQ